jgi:hypothetical protein
MIFPAPRYTIDIEKEVDKLIEDSSRLAKVCRP